jgi:LmbE family N-acetylglucosaminyl deacetylase
MSDREDPSILVICAHPDDEILGAGGTIVNHTSQGIPVDVMCLTSTVSRKKELESACQVLKVRNIYIGIRDDFAIDMSLQSEIVDILLKSRPTIVITHSPVDYNHNHVACHDVVRQAIEWASHSTVFDNAHMVERTYNMEINSLLSQPQAMVDISETFATSLEALKKHVSQMSKANGFYARLYDSRTRLRGVQAACDRAEAFTVELPTHAGPFYPRNSAKTLF